MVTASPGELRALWRAQCEQNELEAQSEDFLMNDGQDLADEDAIAW
jgi:hypothetical protein